MSEYTTTELRRRVAIVLDHTQGWKHSEEEAQRFDRWLAAELAAAKAEAWDEGYIQGKGAGVDFFTRGISEPGDSNPYRADEIERTTDER